MGILKGEAMDIGGPILENLLDTLKGFIEEQMKDYRLPVKQERWTDQPLYRPAEVAQMVMPDPDEDNERIPYIELQVLNGKDERDQYGRMHSIVSVRIIITLFNKDKFEGRMQVLHIVQRLRKALIQAGVIGGCFELQWPLEYLIYPDDTEWYHLGEMATVWSVPSIERDVPGLR